MSGPRDGPHSLEVEIIVAIATEPGGCWVSQADVSTEVGQSQVLFDQNLFLTDVFRQMKPLLLRAKGNVALSHSLKFS